MTDDFKLRAIYLSPEDRKFAYEQDINNYNVKILNKHRSTWTKGTVATILAAITIGTLMDDTRPDYLAWFTGIAGAYTFYSTVKGIQRILYLGKKRRGLEEKLSEIEDDI